MLKNIAVNLTMDGRRDPAPEFAISVAQKFGAQLSGVAFVRQPVMSASIIAALPPDILETARAASEKAAQEVVASVIAAAKQANVPIETNLVVKTYPEAAEFFGRFARTFDLAIVGQAAPEDTVPEDRVVESALFESGRPIIVVPYIQKDPLVLDRIMVCWDGSRTAARALGDAAPFLAHAKSVEVVTVLHKDEPEVGPATSADVVRCLATRGLKAKSERLVAPEVDVADMLLSYAADSEANFMVMGGYGHSRLREVVLGGVTRAILASMTVPVLMSH